MSIAQITVTEVNSNIHDQLAIISMVKNERDRERKKERKYIDCLKLKKIQYLSCVISINLKHAYFLFYYLF